MTAPAEQHTIIKAAALDPKKPTHAALGLRKNVVDLIDAAEQASLKPNDPGGISHDLRAALATRASRLNQHAALAHHYGAMVAAEGAICDPEYKSNDNRLQAILNFSDKVTTAPRDAAADDIAELKTAGVRDADIVRLCELLAFLAFQYRVVAGLSLMEKTA
ncbi:CMD domain-containing protein [Aliiroseovarius sp. YM-037]|uniref:CMD domain-containing protein n=1 Tax=Aliiroseovarius sp. YM-037 TaxID=3341728 RepID=UPI003A80388A